jgi:pyrroloquinoline quinone (PQQ) biosynthesis protein C
MSPEDLAVPVPAASLASFKERVERELFRHPVITDNAYTRWFSRGEASRSQLEDLLLQFSVFSNHFLVVQAKRMVNAANEEAERGARFILMSECGVELDRETGSTENRAFKTASAHINWLRQTGTAIGIEARRMGHWSAGTPATHAFLDGLDRTYGSRDGWIGAGASFAIENWAGFGIGRGPELEARNFWKELIVGLEGCNRKSQAAGQAPLPLDFFQYHFELESAHAANVWHELEETFSDPAFDQDKYIAGGKEALDSISLFWEGLDSTRRVIEQRSEKPRVQIVGEVGSPETGRSWIESLRPEIELAPE